MQIIEFSKKIFGSYAFWAGILGALIPLAVMGIAVLIRTRKERKKARNEELRKVEFTLPDTRNSYVRARLNTALRTENCEEEESTLALQLAYARELLYKLKSAPLAAAERLELNEMGSALALYSEKEKWSAFDLRAVNDCLGRLLKLSAKYTI